MSYFRRREARPIAAPQTEGSQEKQPFFAPKNDPSNDASSEVSTPRKSLESMGNGFMKSTEITPVQHVFESRDQIPGATRQSIPDQRNEALACSNKDSLSPTLSHLASVSRSGSVSAGNFGETNSNITFQNMNVTSSGTKHVLTAEVNHTIWWQVRGGVGPDGQVNIAGESDPAITAANYETVADDLTPDSTGRSPRSSFWAKDLTEQHEQYHAVNQRQNSFGPKVVRTMQRWLKKQTVAGAADINATLMGNARSQGVTAYNKLIGLPSTEDNAYKDGKSAYKARAKAIRKKGKAGGY